MATASTASTMLPQLLQQGLAAQQHRSISALLGGGGAMVGGGDGGASADHHSVDIAARARAPNSVAALATAGHCTQQRSSLVAKAETQVKAEVKSEKSAKPESAHAAKAEADRMHDDESDGELPAHVAAAAALAAADAHQGPALASASRPTVACNNVAATGHQECVYVTSGHVGSARFCAQCSKYHHCAKKTCCRCSAKKDAERAAKPKAASDLVKEFVYEGTSVEHVESIMRFELPRTLGEPWAHYVRVRNEAAHGRVVRSVWTCHCHFKPKSADDLEKTVKIQQGTNVQRRRFCVAALGVSYIIYFRPMCFRSTLGRQFHERGRRA